MESKINYTENSNKYFEEMTFKIYRHKNAEKLDAIYNINSLKNWPKNKRLVSGIYLVFCTGNQKVYIGQSVNIYNRISQHTSKLRKNIHPNPYLQRAFIKYGPESFYFTILEQVIGKNELTDAEIKWIKVYNSLQDGFNVSSVSKEVVVPFVVPGITTRGENNVHSKLKNEDVMNICLAINNGIPVKKISEVYGVTPNVISAIKNGKKWQHISRGILNEEKMNDERRLEYGEVAMICIMLNRGIKKSIIAREFGISFSMVSYIFRGERHKEIGEEFLFSKTSMTINSKNNH